MIRQRGNIYQLVRRVPRRYRSVEGREIVWISLHTDSESVAKIKAPIAWNEMVQAWEAKLRGDGADAEARFHAAQELAATRGFRYMPVARVAKLPSEELLRRVEAVSVSKGEPNRSEAAAFLGAEAEPRITVSRSRTQ